MQDRLKDIKQGHDAVRAYIKQLSGLINDLALERIGVRPNDKQLKVLKDKLWNLEQSLHHFREGIREHIVHDEKALSGYSSTDFAELMTKQHEEIEGEYDRVLTLVNRANPADWNDEELQRFISTVREVFNKVSELVLIHMATEDSIIEILWKD